MANQSIAIEPFKKLISEYKKLDPIPERESTIFEISGYPHFEEVISNVMAFFFRTDEKHSFSSVFVESLLAAANTLNDDLPSSFAVEKVEREVLTNTGNRIDLVIETDSVCIAIENKIYANLYNNLNDYQDFIEARYPEHKRMFFVLSLREIEQPIEWEEHDFTIITYQDFFAELEERLGSVLLNTDTKFLVYLSDLIKTLRHMSENTALTPEFLNFLQEHRSDIESLYKDAFKKLKDEAKSKADEIENLINLENTGFRSFNYNPGNQLKFVRVFEKEIEWEGKKFNIKIKLRFRPAKCTVEIWVEKSSETKIFQDYISQIFDKDFDDWKNHQDNELGSIEYSEFKLAPDAENVSKEIEHLILKINLTSD